MKGIYLFMFLLANTYEDGLASSYNSTSKLNNKK